MVPSRGNNLELLAKIDKTESFRNRSYIAGCINHWDPPVTRI
jgi:hypothetical protein